MNEEIAEKIVCHVRKFPAEKFKSQKDEAELVSYVLNELNLQNGLLQISCEQKAGLLESCETALNERDQQNESLLAQVEGLRGELYYFVGRVKEGTISSTVTVVRFIDALAKTPEQSLDSLKASIEEETIDRLIKKVINEIDWIAGSNFEMIANDLPRKYPSKADKGEME